MNVYRDKHDTGYLELEEDYSNLFEKHDEIKVFDPVDHEILEEFEDLAEKK